MPFIESLKLTGFKSFKRARIEFPTNFVCLAGPNGSGKSNICDALRFVLGERSLKTLRARKSKDLIFINASSAEVSVVVSSGGKKNEIKRGINKEGKVFYKIDGKNCTQKAVLDLLRKRGFDGTARNIIAQGEVSKIIHMSGKDKRKIIDGLSGIEVFEEKKKESERELSSVEERIKEGSIIMGERSHLLEELGKEREKALAYKKAKKDYRNAKGTLLESELKECGEKLEKTRKEIETIEKGIEKKNEELEKCKKRMEKLDERRRSVSAMISEFQKEGLSAGDAERLRAVIEEENRRKAEMKETISAMKERKRKLSERISEIKKRMGEIEQKIAGLEASTPSMGKGEEFEKNISFKKEELKKIRKRKAELSEKARKLEREISYLEAVISEKEESSRLDGDVESFEDIKKRVEELKKKKRDVDNEIRKLFEEERKANEKLAEMDRKILKLREEVASLKGAGRSGMNRAVAFVRELKEMGDIPGIYGILGELISFDQKYRMAVDACLGGRVFYIVVKDSSVASKVISLLKSRKAGRATFIPLKEIRAEKPKGDGLLIEKVSYHPEVEKAVWYAFSDTILVSGFEEAKRKGIGRKRMVSIEGDLFERSGIISGGRERSSSLASVELGKKEKELEMIKSEREGVLSELVDIRNLAGEKRKEKSHIEVELKKAEVELDRIEKQRAKTESEERKREMEIEKAKAEIKRKKVELSNIDQEISKAESDEMTISEEIEKIEEERIKSIRESGEKEKKVASELSSLKTELSERSAELKEKESEIESVDSELKEAMEKLGEAEARIEKSTQKLEEIEGKLKKASRKLDMLFSESREIDEEISKEGEISGRISAEIRAMEKRIYELRVSEASLKTRFEDLKGELEGFGEFSVMEGDKEHLKKVMKEADETLKRIGDVNLSAIDLYVEKEAELNELKSKVDGLKREREAIMKMMGEIERRKKDLFMKTFKAVNENFEMMVSHLNMGKGHIELTNYSNPFDASLILKINRGDKDISLDSLSGGEKSLIALAFIFATQFVKPSPFYILDEVDAALDKKNVSMLASLVKQISKNSQVIVVSHNDYFIENAEIVVGVSKEKGVSKVVSVNLERVGAMG